MVDEPNASPKPKTWRRVALIAFSVGAGIVIAVACVIGAVEWYQNRPVLMTKEWKPLQLSSRKIKGVLKTEWRDGALKYRFYIEPEDKNVADQFASVVRNGRATELASANVELLDSAGFALCKISVLHFAQLLGDTGIIGIGAEGDTRECSRPEYVQAVNWNFGGRFLPDLSATTPVNTVTKTSSTPFVRPDPEDSLTGFDYLSTHHLETRSGHTFLIERGGEQDTAHDWAIHDSTRGTSTKLKLTCKSAADCLIENEDNGQAVHGRMIR